MMPILKFVIQVQQHAKENGLQPSLVAAICSQESAGDPYACRYEPEWHYFKDVAANAKRCRISEDTEKTAQAFSFGLMQIMGSVARERGFIDALPKLFDVDINLHYGCMHLKAFLDKHKNEQHAIASYNAGSPRFTEDGKYVNQLYVNKVIAFKQSLLGIDNA